MWYGVLCRKCRGWMWNINLWWWDVECITRGRCISHLITLPPHFTLHHSTSNAVWHSKPHHIPSRQFLTISHISYRTNTSRSTLFHFAIPYRFQISPYRPHYASHPIFTFLTYHITPHSTYSTPHFRSHHILATSFIRTTFYTRHCTTLHMHHILHHSTTSLWPWAHPHPTIPHPTPDHFSHNIPHRPSVAPPLSTSHHWIPGLG